jgi:hypothetical protein
MVYLKKFEWVKLFCQDFKNESRYYILFCPDLEALKLLTRVTFKQVHDQHWKIKSFHRAIKKGCTIERFQVRNEQAVRNHFFCALRVFSMLQTMRIEGVIDNRYPVSRQLFISVIQKFILENLSKPVST